MLLKPNCKLNIGLRVIRKRSDGYHDLDTIFYPVYNLYDELEVTISNTLSFAQEGIKVDCPQEDNLIIKCYHLMANQYPIIKGASIRLKKNIPFGAGLGGGSSDAAHVAIALNELYNIGLAKNELAKLVRPLGADCPFFIYNTPCYATGIGDILTPIDFSLAGLHLIMLKPDISISTREAYAGITLHPEVDCELRNLSVYRIGEAINDFEQTVFINHPILGHIKKRLLDAGAFYAAMSGSGSTIYGLFKNYTKNSPFTNLRTLEKEFSSMIIFNDTLR